MEYIVIDINNYNEKQLLKLNSKISYAFLIEKNRTKEELIEILEKIAKECNTKEKTEKMYDIIRYILSSTLGEENIENIVKQYKWNGGESILNEREGWIKQINQEKREERRKGKEEGIQEGLHKVAKEMINKKMLIEDISQITGLTKEEINKLKLAN